MHLTGLLITALVASVAARPQEQGYDGDCNRCPDRGMGHGALWSSKDYTGECVCFEAFEHCRNLDDLGFNDRTVSIKQHLLAGSGCVYYLHNDCDNGPRNYAYYSVLSTNDFDSVSVNDLGAPHEIKIFGTSINKNALTEVDKSDDAGFGTQGDTWAENISSVYCYADMDDFTTLHMRR